MFRLPRVIIKPSNEPTQDYLIPSVLWNPVALTIGVVILIIIIIIIIFIGCNWVVTRWQWLFYMYTNMKKKVTRKFNLMFL